MTDYYLDSTTGDDADDGSTPALAWALFEYAIETFGGLVAGDNVWIRRLHSEIPTSDVVPTDDGSAGSLIRFILWPRAAIPNTTITEATWTNGSTTVDLIVGITCDREKHCGRYVTAPDGKQYLITKITDSNTLIIDREYVGSTVTTTDGKFQIEEDEDYDDRPQAGIDAGWDADAIDLPVIDFNDGNYQLLLSTDNYYEFVGIEFKDSTDYGGLVGVSASAVTRFTGCLIKQSLQDDIILKTNAGLTILKRTIIEGSGAGSSQVGVWITSGAILLIDSAIYNCGDSGLICQAGSFFLENVNIGVEAANGDEDIQMRSAGGGIAKSYGRDVKLGGTNGYVSIYSTYYAPYQVSFENYQKILGDHKSFYLGGTWEKAAVTGETPNKKVSDDVIKISPNINYPDLDEAAQIIFTHEFKVTTDQKSYKYWIYNDTGDTLNSGDAKGSIWLELEYVESYDDTSEYITTKEYSVEVNIADAADADDWDYIEIINITPAVAGKLRITCRCRHYTAAGDIFADLAVVIS